MTTAAITCRKAPPDRVVGRSDPAHGDLELAISLMAIRYAASAADYEVSFHTLPFQIEVTRFHRRASDRQLKALVRLVRALANRGAA